MTRTRREILLRRQEGCLRRLGRLELRLDGRGGGGDGGGRRRDVGRRGVEGLALVEVCYFGSNARVDSVHRTGLFVHHMIL